MQHVSATKFPNEMDHPQDEAEEVMTPCSKEPVEVGWLLVGQFAVWQNMAKPCEFSLILHTKKKGKIST